MRFFSGPINQKAYDTIGYIDMVFSVVDSGGTTEYELTEGVDNGTGIDWTDYHVQLGFGTGTSFVQSTAGDGLDFDAPDYNSPYVFSPFTTITFAEDELTIDGGLFLNGTFNNFGFPIDIPDGITTFTLRQFPTIPEPSSLAFVTLSLLALARRARQRRHSSLSLRKSSPARSTPPPPKPTFFERGFFFVRR